jgi:predicted nucleic acid-binding protein
MAKPLVIDASVVVKWLLDESGREEALRLQDAYQDGALDLIAPELLASEIGHVLWKKYTRGELTPEAVNRLYYGFLRDSPVLVDSPKNHARAVALAVEHRRSVYDCQYLALAEDEGCDLITADERFYNAMRSRFACLKLLSA